MGRAMNSTIAISEGRMKAKNVLCGKPRPLEPDQKGGGARSPSRLTGLEEPAFLCGRVIGSLDVGERLGGLFLAGNEVGEFGREGSVQQTHVRLHRVSSCPAI